MNKFKLADLVENFSFRAKNVGGSEGLEFLGVSNEDGITKSKYAAEDKAEDYKIIEKGCFAYNPYRINVGSIAYVNEDIRGLISPAYVIFKTKPNLVDDRLLLKFLKSAEGLRQIKINARGSVRQALRFEDLCKIEISLPEYDKQVEFLDKIDIVDSCSNNVSTEITHQLDLIKNLRQAFLREAMQGLLVSNETSDGKTGADLLVEIQAEKAQLLKDKKIKKGKLQDAETLDELIFDIPENWKWATLDDLTLYITDGTHQTPNYTEKGRIFLSAQNVKPFKFMPENHKYVSQEDYESYINNRLAEKGDLLVARVGAGIGETAVIDRDIEFAFYVSLGLVKPFKNHLSSEFLAYVFNSQYGVKYAKGNISSKGGSAGNFNLGRIRSFLIPLPPLEIQERIVAKLDELMRYCDALEEQVKQSQQTNDLLLQQVLREALGDKKEKKETNVLKIIPKQCNNVEKTILAGYIINQSNTPDFGKVKFQKILHLTEYHCQISMNSNYSKKVAGPHDTTLITNLVSNLQRYNFYKIDDKNKKHDFIEMSSSNELVEKFNDMFDDQKKYVNQIIELFSNKTWEFCELISTLYAVWNNRIINKEDITNEQLTQDFLKWNKSKIKFIDKIDYGIKWIKDNNLEPLGWGNIIE